MDPSRRVVVVCAPAVAASTAPRQQRPRANRRVAASRVDRGRRASRRPLRAARCAIWWWRTGCSARSPARRCIAGDEAWMGWSAACKRPRSRSAPRWRVEQRIEARIATARPHSGAPTALASHPRLPKALKFDRGARHVSLVSSTSCLFLLCSLHRCAASCARRVRGLGTDGATDAARTAKTPRVARPRGRPPIPVVAQPGGLPTRI